jgi:aminoglycoside/choline kinase family phosphotransferase
MGVSDASDSRLTALTRWVVEDLGFADSRIEPASADASFRRYFRVTRGADTYIVMDAPPEKEDVAPFVCVARLLAGMNLNAPLILAQEAQQGFLLLSDLGNRQYLDELKATLEADGNPEAVGNREVDRLYGDALASLVIMQTTHVDAARTLPRYDRTLLLREMELLPEWFLSRHLALPVGPSERQMLDRLFDGLVSAALAQPMAFVHRDYHSRNLLLTDERNPGILDFQDAVWGPITYDAVSLLKDCYIAWPRERVLEWLDDYRNRLLRAGMPSVGDGAEFVRWFDLMGLQRHIKVLGIFARLYYRDGKSGYLNDLPRVLDYTRETTAQYAETAEFARYLREVVDPAFGAAQKRVGARA